MVNLRLLGERNFLACGLIIYISFAVLYGANVDTPQMLQELFGYDAFRAGLVLSPSAFFTMAMMPIVGFLLGRKVDARYIIPFGLLCLAGAALLAGAPGPLHLALHVHRAPMRPDGGRRHAVRAAEQRRLPLPAQESGQQRDRPVQHAAQRGGQPGHRDRHRAGRPPQPVPPVAAGRARHAAQPGGRPLDWITSRRPAWSAAGSRSAVAEQQGMGLLSQMVHNQAREMAYLDAFWMFAIMALALPLVLLMKKSVARGGVAVH